MIVNLSNYRNINHVGTLFEKYMEYATYTYSRPTIEVTTQDSAYREFVMGVPDFELILNSKRNKN